jgi:hypothetical protein
MREFKPSDFACSFPFLSKSGKAEIEIAAQSIMALLAKSGNTFRRLPWREYKRLSGVTIPVGENDFRYARDYCTSEAAARKFSPIWENLGQEN